MVYMIAFQEDSSGWIGLAPDVSDCFETVSDRYFRSRESFNLGEHPLPINT